jgi:cytidylate kinase
MTQLDKSIVVCGRLCSGKSSVIQSIRSMFPVDTVSFGAMVKSKATEMQMEPTRHNLQELGYEFFTSRGPRTLIEMAIENAKCQNATRLIFDGVRHELVLSEIRRNTTTMLVIYLKAGESIRYNRYKKDHGPQELPFEEFQAIDRHPIEIGADSIEQSANLTIDATYSLDCVCRLANEAARYYLSAE